MARFYAWNHAWLFFLYFSSDFLSSSTLRCPERDVHALCKIYTIMRDIYGVPRCTPNERTVPWMVRLPVTCQQKSWCRTQVILGTPLPNGPRPRAGLHQLHTHANGFERARQPPHWPQTLRTIIVQPRPTHTHTGSNRPRQVIAKLHLTFWSRKTHRV